MNTQELKHLKWVKDAEYEVIFPSSTQEEKDSFRKELTEEIESCGFVHEEVKVFVKASHWCEIVKFTLFATPEQRYVIPKDYFIFFVYDVVENKFVGCNVFDELLPAIEAAGNLIDSLARQ